MKRKLMILAVTMVMMALPMSISAQSPSLFGREHGATTKYEGGGDLTSSVFGRESAQYGSQLGVGNQGFGQVPNPVPMGSGVAMLIAAGAGYALLKSKKSK